MIPQPIDNISALLGRTKEYFEGVGEIFKNFNFFRVTMRYFLKIVTVTMRYSFKIVTVTMYNLFLYFKHKVNI